MLLLIKLLLPPGKKHNCEEDIPLGGGDKQENGAGEGEGAGAETMLVMAEVVVLEHAGATDEVLLA